MEEKEETKPPTKDNTSNDSQHVSSKEDDLSRNNKSNEPHSESANNGKPKRVLRSRKAVIEVDKDASIIINSVQLDVASKKKPSSSKKLQIQHELDMSTNAEEVPKQTRKRKNINYSISSDKKLRTQNEDPTSTHDSSDTKLNVSNATEKKYTRSKKNSKQTSSTNKEISDSSELAKISQAAIQTENESNTMEAENIKEVPSPKRTRGRKRMQTNEEVEQVSVKTRSKRTRK